MNLKRKIVSILLSLALVCSLASNAHIKVSAHDSFSNDYPRMGITVNCTLDNETVMKK